MVHLSEAQEKLKKYREDNERKSKEVLELWDSSVKHKIKQLGNDRYLVLEQVLIAACDCNRIDVAKVCLQMLLNKFPDSLRVRRLAITILEAEEKYDEALESLDKLIKADETNAQTRRHKVAILKAKCQISEAIKELVEYLKKFMVDQEGWQELSNLYLLEGEYAKSAYCMEEMILHNSQNHLYHQRNADIRYTQGGTENLELARAHYSYAILLNPNNIRALYGLYLTARSLMSSQKNNQTKKNTFKKIATLSLKRVEHMYSEKKQLNKKNQLYVLETLMGSLHLSLN
ncbi:ER membrane protein complex subunit 2-like [Rhopalosiphum padi]|uniref:ER membrane protein complex subunit 2 n=1 Tax=Melanaphis sacchari TaxID=742174 RepID=A0A2H8TNA9_9HEMI|nr:ER membrane protein complex subunit 2-like [Myzus persicae]XP_025201450.1 ER membrane protein complex subunit 2-like [Melanaphis sacchari]XP_060854751.1 ER membrane protein complex subunit 2-like [Rhopalosiphum padi]